MTRRWRGSYTSSGDDGDRRLVLECEMARIADAVLFRSDQERALLSLKDEAAVRAKQKGGTV